MRRTRLCAIAVVAMHVLWPFWAWCVETASGCFAQVSAQGRWFPMNGKHWGDLDDSGMTAFDPNKAEYTARDLVNTAFDDTRWIVPGYVPEGLTIVAGKPKIGKSWWILWHALQVGHRVPVLYLSLEDHYRRLSSRLAVLAPDGVQTDNVVFHVKWPLLAAGGLDAIEAWLVAQPHGQLVVIDTVTKLLAGRKAGSDAYKEDVAEWGRLHDLTRRFPGRGIVAVHHQRKGEADDPLDTVIGSQGVIGTADTILLLRRDRGSPDGRLLVVGRDIEQDVERDVRFENGRWTDLGPLGSSAHAGVVNAIGELGEAGVADLMNVLDLDRNAVKMRLDRAVKAGVVRRVGRGTYALPPVP